MKIILSLLIVIAACASIGKPNICEAKGPIKIAIIDTGMGFNTDSEKDIKLCKYGHKDFSITQVFDDKFQTVDKVPKDFHGHGTNLAGVIEKYAKDAEYCLVIVKYWESTMTSPQASAASVKAWHYINQIKPDVVNYSGGGAGWDQQEYNEVKKFLDNGGTIVAAAGNDGQDLDVSKETYYPAMYDKRIVMVGNASAVLMVQKRDAYLYKKNLLVQVDQEEFFRLPSQSSNFGGPISRWELGESVEGYGLFMTGTSQATATATGKIVGQMKKGCVK